MRQLVGMCRQKEEGRRQQVERHGRIVRGYSARFLSKTGWRTPPLSVEKRGFGGFLAEKRNFRFSDFRNFGISELLIYGFEDAKQRVTLPCGMSGVTGRCSLRHVC